MPNSLLVGRLGYYLPFSVVGSVLVAIANGLLSSLSPGTSTGKWIGYQIIAGAGRGLAMQVVRHPFFTTKLHLTSPTNPPFFLPSRSSRFKTPYPPSRFPSPWRFSCSAKRLLEHCSSVSLLLSSPIASKLSSPNTRLQSIPRPSSMPALRDSGR
jgi:hypothetical protein